MSVIGDSFATRKREDVVEIRRRLVDATRSEVGFERLAENACSLALQSLVVNAIDQPLNLTGLSAGEVVLFGTSGKALLEAVNISRLDARGVDLKEITFSECLVSTMLVDETTNFGEQPPAIDHLMIEVEGRQRILYSPGEIAAWIATRGSGQAPVGGTNPEAVALLAKVARIFTRQFFIKDDDSEANGRYLASPLWQQIEEILKEAGRLRRNDRQGTAGRNSDFIHIVNANALLASTTEQDRKIWTKVAALS